MIVTAVLGLALGVGLALWVGVEDEVVAPPAEVAPPGGPISLRIEDASGDVPLLAPSVVEVSSGGETVTFEQYQSDVGRAVGLRWDEEHPLVVTYRPWDLTREPGMTVTLDLAPLGAELREAALAGLRAGPLPMDVHVRVEPARAVILVAAGGVILAEETVPRPDWRRERSDEVDACASALEDALAPARTEIAALRRLIETWYGRSQSYEAWVSTSERGLQQLRTAVRALPGTETGVTELPRGEAWLADSQAALGELEQAIQALRSASLAQSESRYRAAFERISAALYERVSPAAVGARPELWCAAG